MGQGHRRVKASGAGLSIAALLLIAGAYAGEQTFESASACLVTEQAAVPIKIELARSPAQRQQGLMNRTSLPEYQGMLFIYKSTRPPEHTFWMHNTLIPLDIAFIDSGGTIRAINTMVPCTNTLFSCPTYPAGASFQLALEMNQDFFANHRISVGDRFVQSGGSESAGSESAGNESTSGGCPVR